MYQIARFEIPKERKFGEYALELIREIKNGINVEENEEKLFRMSYPIMIKEVYKYTDIRPVDELLADLSVSFMTTLKSFNIDKEQGSASFIGYYKKAFCHEVMHSYFGYYVGAHPEKRKDCLYFKKSIGSLDALDEYMCKNAKEATHITINDIMEDTSINIEQEVIDKTFKDTIHYAIEKIFNPDGRGRGPRVENARNVFTTYIDSIIDDTPMTYDQIGGLYNTTKSNVCGILKRYLPRLQEQLKELGYIF